MRTPERSHTNTHTVALYLHIAFTAVTRFVLFPRIILHFRLNAIIFVGTLWLSNVNATIARAIGNIIHTHAHTHTVANPRTHHGRGRTQSTTHCAQLLRLAVRVPAAEPFHRSLPVAQLGHHGIAHGRIGRHKCPVDAAQPHQLFATRPEAGVQAGQKAGAQHAQFGVGAALHVQTGQVGQQLADEVVLGDATVDAVVFGIEIVRS